MTRRWPGCVKIHEGCGGLVQWVEAVRTPGVGYYGECTECGDRLDTEEIIPIELPEDVREAHQHEWWVDQDVETLRSLTWEGVEWEENQARFREALTA